MALPMYVLECIYPEIQSCAGSGRLCLFPAPRLALCAELCGPDDRHIDAGRREHYGRQVGALSTPPWVLRHTTREDEKNGEEPQEKYKRIRKKVKWDYGPNQKMQRKKEKGNIK